MMPMFGARTSSARHTDAEQAEAEEKNDIAVVPLAIPLLAGPGAISLTIVDAHQVADLSGKLVFSLGIVGVAVIVWMVLRLAEPIGERLGTGGLETTDEKWTWRMPPGAERPERVLSLTPATAWHPECPGLPADAVTIGNFSNMFSRN